MARFPWLALVTILLAGSKSLRAAALPQGGGSRETTTSLALGTVSNSPEGEVSMPLYLSLAPSVLLGRITAEVVFPNQELTWVRVEPGLQADLKVKAEPRNAPDKPSQSVVHLEISAEGSKGIANGLVASLRLRVNKDTKPGGVPVSIAKVSAIELGTPDKPANNITGFSARVEVVPPGANPYIGCFFLTH